MLGIPNLAHRLEIAEKVAYQQMLSAHKTPRPTFLPFFSLKKPIPVLTNNVPRAKQRT